MKLSARNVMPGKVTGVKKGTVNSEVTLALAGGTPITAIITNGSVERLALREGADACAIVKASAVIVGTDLHDAQVSARNIMCGTVARIVDGPVSAEVDIDVGGRVTISAVITEGSARSLGLKEGGHACALIKATSVIIGVG